MPRLIDTALRAAAAAAEEPLALLQEGNIAVGIKRGLLQANYVLREGSPRRSEDWLISGSPASLIARLVDRVGDGETKSDMRIELRWRIAIELKVFGEVGSKDSFNRGDISSVSGGTRNAGSFLWDLQAVMDRQAHAAFLVCGARQYDTARGAPWDSRGRGSAVVLESLLPSRSELQRDIASVHRTWRDLHWEARGLLVVAPAIVETGRNGKPRRAAEERVVLALRLERAQ